MVPKFSTAQIFSLSIVSALLAAIGLSLPAPAAQAYPLSSMGLEFVTTGSNEVAQIGLGGTLTNVTIDWGDGSSLQSLTDGVGVPDAFISHTYLNPGTYVAVVSATTLSHVGKCSNPTNNWNLKRILSWGSMNTTDMTCAAWSRTALTSVPSALPSSVTDLDSMFYDTHVFNQDLSGWNTSNVTSMERTFQSSTSFNRSLAAWDISNVSHALGILTNTAIDDTNYSSTLVGWAAQTVMPNLDLDAIPAKAVGCPAIAARNTLTNSYNWRIVDTAPTQSCAAQTVTWAPSNTTGQTGTLTPNTLAVASDAGAITYSVQNAGSTGCSVNAISGVITSSAAGDCVIRATAAATPGFFAGVASVTFSFANPPSALANTGGNIAWLIVLGILLVIAGSVVAISIASNRRRNS